MGRVRALRLVGAGLGVRRDDERLLGAFDGQVETHPGADGYLRGKALAKRLFLIIDSCSFLSLPSNLAGKESPFAKFLTRFSKGDFIFRQGEEGDEMYIVQSGQVAIRKTIAGKRKTVNVLEKGDFFGEMSVLERLPRTADAEVLEDTGVISINSATFGEMIRSNPEIAVRMLRKYSMRMREYSE